MMIKITIILAELRLSWKFESHFVSLLLILKVQLFAYLNLILSDLTNITAFALFKQFNVLLSQSSNLAMLMVIY